MGTSPFGWKRQILQPKTVSGAQDRPSEKGSRRDEPLGERVCAMRERVVR